MIGNKVFFILLLCWATSGFAQTNLFSHMNKFYDSRALQALVNEAPTDNCRHAEYVEQVKAFLVTSVDYYRFIPAANGAFSWQQAQLLKQISESDAQNGELKLSSCFVEALFSAIMPDILKVHKVLKVDLNLQHRVLAELMNDRELNNNPQDLYVIRTVKSASIAYSLLAISKMRSCDFQADPFIFLSATYKMQSLIDLAYHGMGVLSIIRSDECSIQAYKDNERNYNDVINQKIVQYWSK